MKKRLSLFHPKNLGVTPPLDWGQTFLPYGGDPTQLSRRVSARRPSALHVTRHHQEKSPTPILKNSKIGGAI